MDALREGVYLRAYAQKDPLIEYKTEAYEMFAELMANIKNEVLHNLFRSTSNLQAFENFLSTLPQFLMREQAPSAPTRHRPGAGRRPDTSVGAGCRQWRGRRRRFGGEAGTRCRCAAKCRKSAATSRARAAAARNTRTAAAVSPNA